MCACQRVSSRERPQFRDPLTQGACPGIPRLLPNRSRFRLCAAWPTRAAHVALWTLEHGLDPRDLAAHKLENLCIEYFIRVAHAFGEGYRLAIEGPGLDIAAAHEVESSKHQLTLGIDDWKMSILIARDEGIRQAAELIRATQAKQKETRSRRRAVGRRGHLQHGYGRVVVGSECGHPAVFKAD